MGHRAAVALLVVLLAAGGANAARPDPKLTLKQLWQSWVSPRRSSSSNGASVQPPLLVSSNGASVRPQLVWAVRNADGSFSAVGEQPPNGPPAPAAANYSHWRNHKSGFGQLRISTHGSYNNEVQMQAAGFVEGYATAPEIFSHWHNWRWWLSQQTNDTYRVMDWLMTHHSWWREQMAAPANAADPFWQAQRLVAAQLDGMVAGYSARVTAEGSGLGIDFIPFREWLTLNTMGDMDDLLEALFPASTALHDMEPAALRTRLETRGRCSVLIKVTPDLSDLLVGHATWWTYTGMTRIFKHVSLALRGEQFKGAALTSMSSYPGMLTSMDDFYIVGGSHMVVTETSIGIMDASLWRQVVPQAALSWQRMLAANWLSSDGSEWAHWIQRHNSGTYNNEYMVVDLKKFTPGSELREGLLTVVEQMPGLVEHADKTRELERGYWPSYNIPYFHSVYNRSGAGQLAARLQHKRGYSSVVNGLSYQLAPRAKIARRDQGGVLTLADLQAYMRGNDWANDPLSGGSPFGAVCSRGDLDPAHPKASGCNDAKVTSYHLAMANTAYAVNGPTAGTRGALGAFSWEKWPQVAHRGQPDVFEFKFERQQP